eukprot:s458_g12.t1
MVWEMLARCVRINIPLNGYKPDVKKELTVRLTLKPARPPRSISAINFATEPLHRGRFFGRSAGLLFRLLALLSALRPARERPAMGAPVQDAINLRIDALRLPYRRHAEMEHGTIINPITGDEMMLTLAISSLISDIREPNGPTGPFMKKPVLPVETAVDR